MLAALRSDCAAQHATALPACTVSPDIHVAQTQRGFDG